MDSFDKSSPNNKFSSDDEPLHTFMFINDFPESDMSALVGTNAFVLQQISQGGLIPVLGTMIELPYTIFCDIPTSKQLVELGYSESSSQNQDLASSQAIQIKWLNKNWPKSMEKLNVDITIWYTTHSCQFLPTFNFRICYKTGIEAASQPTSS